MSTGSSTSNARLGILFILIGMTAISVNDMLIKALSGNYPLHQMVFVRSAIGITFSLVLVQIEGGWKILRTNQPGWHMLRGLLIVTANMTFFAALAVLPLAEATALFFVAPLFITLLSIPILGEKVGPYRIGAVLVGLLGVVVMLRPWQAQNAHGVERWMLLLPILAAAAYAGMQILTRRLGVTSKASAMATYIQGMFLVVSVVFFAIAGDGEFADGLTNPSLIFLLRAWVWPTGNDIWLFLLLGLSSGVIGYSMSQAYRQADVGLIAPFEYTALPLAVFWGWMVFGELPGFVSAIGISLILAAGIFVFVREHLINGRRSGRRPLRRH
ncbi:MAG: DMT family transporter [Pseudomonadota bacterium]